MKDIVLTVDGGVKAKPCFLVYLDVVSSSVMRVSLLVLLKKADDFLNTAKTDFLSLRTTILQLLIIDH